MAGPDRPQCARPLFARPDFQAVAGRTLRPGGTVLTERLLDRLSPPAGAKVLDVGCGRGATLDLLASRGLRGVGVDLSRELIGQAGSALRCVGSALALPLKPETFSAVVCECVLSLVADKSRVLVEMARTLAPGGLLGLADLYLRPARNANAGRKPETACGANGRNVIREAPARPSGCPSGALPRAVLESLLRESGFTVLTFEDHSRALAELAAELLFSGLPREALGLCAPDAGRAGYCTCVARKETP